MAEVTPCARPEKAAVNLLVISKYKMVINLMKKVARVPICHLYYCKVVKIFLHKNPQLTQNNVVICFKKEILYMKATGIVRRIVDLGRVVIPKEIRKL